MCRKAQIQVEVKRFGELVFALLLANTVSLARSCSS